MIWSDRYREIYGVAPNAPLSHELFLDAIDPKDRDYVRDAHADALKQRKQYGLQYRIVLPDGSRRWISAIGPGCDDTAGNPIRIEGAVLDSIEEKMAAENLLASEKRYHALIEQSPDGIGLISANGKVLYLSPATTRMTGYAFDERLGRFYFDRVHPDDLATVHETLTFVRQKPSVRETLQFRYRDKDGSWRWIESVLTNMLDEPSIRAIIYNDRDIAERKETERALIKSEERLKMTLAAASMSSWDFDLATERMTWEETLALVHPDDRASVTRVIDGSMNEGGDYQLEYRTVAPDGTVRWLATNGRTFLDRTGRAVRTMGVSRDITEHKRAEVDLKTRNQELHWLHEISQEILASQHLKAMPKIILEKALSVSSCDLGIIRLMNQTTGFLEPVASQGYKDPESPSQHRKIVKNGTTDSLAQTLNLKHTLVQERLQDKPGVQNFKNEGIQSLITVPVRADNHVLGILQLGNRTARTFQPDLINFLETLGCNLGIAVQMNNHLDDALASQTQLRNLTHKLVEAQETERRHIARELHDEIGQELTALKLSLGLAARSESGHDKSRLDDAAELIDDLVAKVRDFSLRLRPAILDDLGLLPALLWYFKSFTAQTNIQVYFQHTLDRRFSTELETAAYRIVQESLTNVARHAKVSEISVRISINRQLFRIEIQDHGAGFDPTTATDKTAGLTGMSERAAAVGGHITVLSAAGAGTLMTAEFPLEEGRSDFTESRSAYAEL